MALTLRRSQHESRIELTPLLDVIFLLLTFFIYSQVMQVRAEILPIKLPQLSGGQTADVPSLFAITVDDMGQVFVNREPVTEAELDAQLGRAMNSDDPPRVYLALEAGEGRVDRAPIMLRLVQTIRAAGVEDFAFVGDPASEPDANP